MRVIVTRPERDAHRWVEALSRRGVDAIALPLIRIEALGDAASLAQLRAAWHRLPDYAALMFVSASAVAYFFAQRPSLDRGLDVHPDLTPRFWATGPATAAALLRRGVNPSRLDAPAADSAQFDSEALWQVVGGCVRAGERVLVVRGRDDPARLADRGTRSSDDVGSGRDWLAQSLRAAGVQVDFLVAYCRCAPVLEPPQRALALQAASDGSLWLFSSAQALANLMARMPDQDWSRARALATHPRIAQAARDAGFSVVSESRPGMDDLVASIESTI